MIKPKDRQNGFMAFGTGLLEAIDNYRSAGYYCRIYKCDGKSINKAGYCEEHASPLRPGLPPGVRGCAPVIRRKVSNK